MGLDYFRGAVEEERKEEKEEDADGGGEPGEEAKEPRFIENFRSAQSETGGTNRFRKLTRECCRDSCTLSL